MKLSAFKGPYFVIFVWCKDTRPWWCLVIKCFSCLMIQTQKKHVYSLSRNHHTHKQCFIRIFHFLSTKKWNGGWKEWKKLKNRSKKKKNGTRDEKIEQSSKVRFTSLYQTNKHAHHILTKHRQVHKWWNQERKIHITAFLLRCMSKTFISVLRSKFDRA